MSFAKLEELLNSQLLLHNYYYLFFLGKQITISFMKEGRVTTTMQVGSIQNEGLDKTLDSWRLEEGDVKPKFKNKLVLAKEQHGLREGRVLAVKGQTIFRFKAGKKAEPVIFGENEAGTTVTSTTGEEYSLNELLIPKISVSQNILA